MIRPLTGKCKNCNKPRRGDTKFCSMKCYCENRKKITHSETKCDYCGKSILKLYSRLKYCERSFCDNDCRLLGFQIKPPRKAGGFWYENGYKIIHIGKGVGIKEHIKIIQERIGRKLKSNECVHHVNGIKTDNRIENLLLMTKSDHQKLHRAQQLGRINFLNKVIKG